MLLAELEELARIAAAATPGPWRWWTSNSRLRLSSDVDRRDGGVVDADVNRHDWVASLICKREDREYIAAVAPNAVTRLIETTIAWREKLNAERAERLRWHGIAAIRLNGEQRKEQKAKDLAAEVGRLTRANQEQREEIGRLNRELGRLEDQDSIEAWRSETFGPYTNRDRLAARANVEMAELLTAIVSGATLDEIAAECADVLIVLYGVAEAIGVSLHHEVDKKMVINRARRWNTAGGASQHVADAGGNDT